MKTIPLTLLAALGLAFLAASGCGHMEMDLASEGDPNRVLTGTVETRDAMLLPQNAVAVVRVLDASRMPEQVLGETEIRNPGATPIPFRIEYRADDALLLRGLNLEARISYDGKVHYSTMNQVVVTLRNATDAHRVTVSEIAP